MNTFTWRFQGCDIIFWGTSRMLKWETKGSLEKSVQVLSTNLKEVYLFYLKYGYN